MNALRNLRNFILPIKEINQLLPVSGIIYEVGCGYGSLSYEISGFSVDRQVVGIDINKRKINDAENAFNKPNLDYVAADALNYTFKNCSGVVLSDFLHHVDWISQQKILDQVIIKLNKGGILILKEIVSDDGWRMRVSRLWDLVLYPFDRIYYRSRSEWKKVLLNAGLSVDIQRHISWFPGSTILFVCKK